MSWIRSPFERIFGRKPNNPEFYWVTCMKCGWENKFTLASGRMTIVPAPDETEPDGPQHVTKLPKRCPKCGARLEKYKVPPPIKN